MQILDGKVSSQVIKDELAAEIKTLKKAPHLAAVLVGKNGASQTYVASKVKNCKEVGFESTLIECEDTTSEAELLKIIDDLNKDKNINGILVQLPLPKQINEQRIIQSIDPLKDVDGFHPVSVGKMVQGIDTFISATPYGIMLLLEQYKIDIKGKHAVVIGRSNIVCRPMSILLSKNETPGNATVTLCHSHTKNIKEICQTADITVTALGQPGFLKSDFVKDGVVVIDVGITRVADATKKSGFSIKGDVDFESVAPKCSYITPVPGGVGLMTIAGLLKNTLKAYYFQQSTDLKH
ncbi:MAG: tetrahydrofolate dehydrogenase/cyclohydrolase catalytic domain-containing protein [Ginsengibacter sp.]